MQFDILYKNQGKTQEFSVLETSLPEAMCAFWDEPEGQTEDGHLKVITGARKKGTIIPNMEKEINKDWRDDAAAR